MTPFRGELRPVFRLQCLWIRVHEGVCQKPNADAMSPQLALREICLVTNDTVFRDFYFNMKNPGEIIAGLC